MHLASSPAWSIRSRGPTKPEPTAPGPGTYSPFNPKFSSPSHQLSRSSRSQDTLSQTPGPGAYNPSSNCRDSAPSYRINSTPRILHKVAYSPGPGSYNVPDSNHRTQGGKFGTSERFNSVKDFSASILLKTCRGKAITRANSVSALPGPGSYHSELNKFITKDRAPAYGLGSASRMPRAKSANPGPGRYNLKNLQSGPKWSFGIQPRESDFMTSLPLSYSIINTVERKSGLGLISSRSLTSRDTPGPGSYTLATDHSNNPSWSLSKAPREHFSGKIKHSPGPGSHSPSRKLSSTGNVFGSAKRAMLGNPNHTPGPGAYNTEIKSTAPAYTIRPRAPETRNNNYPGPGEYGKSDKSLFNDSENYRNPAFNTSNGRFNNLGLRANDYEGPKWSFTKSSRGKNMNIDSPGPGSYNIQSSISNLPTYVSKTFR